VTSNTRRSQPGATRVTTLSVALTAHALAVERRECLAARLQRLSSHQAHRSRGAARVDPRATRRAREARRNETCARAERFAQPRGLRLEVPLSRGPGRAQTLPESRRRTAHHSPRLPANTRSGSPEPRQRPLARDEQVVQAHVEQKHRRASTPSAPMAPPARVAASTRETVTGSLPGSSTRNGTILRSVSAADNS